MHLPTFLKPLLPAALLALAACGGDDTDSDPEVDCSMVGPPAGWSFSAHLAASGSAIPADLSITLTGAGPEITETWAQISAGAPSLACRADTGVTCTWGDGSPGPGTLDATAAGFAPVHLDLEATPASCGGANPDHQEATLTPQ
ncbi:MAG: hypothetical protein IT372_08325 [Polyangiaceae bacterium]|nr:hypothetical protein [Polyangiaceae bacterium]